MKSGKWTKMNDIINVINVWYKEKYFLVYTFILFMRLIFCFSLNDYGE